MEEYKSVPQVNAIEDREVYITIDYFTETIFVYSNNATVMNRMGRAGFRHYSEQTNKKGQVMARQYRLPMKSMGQFLKVGLYRIQE